MTTLLKNEIQYAHDLVKEHDHVLLTTHERADGDGVGSLLALSSAFEKRGMQVHRVITDGVPRNLTFLHDHEKVKSHHIINQRTLAIILDASELSRTGIQDEIISKRNAFLDVINIDHHNQSELFGDVNIVDEGVSSTAELVYEFLQHSNMDIDMESATCLLTGIFTDTGGFKHSNTSTRALKIASELMEKGARLNKISNQISNGSHVPALHIWGQALSRVKILKNLGLAVSFITQEDLQKYHADIDDVSGVVSVINTIPGIKSTLLLVQAEDNMIKGSLRSEEGRGVDVSRIARFFGGGGHKLASGFNLKGRMVQKDGTWKIV